MSTTDRTPEKRPVQSRKTGNRSPGTGTMRERPPGSGHWQLRVYSGSDPVTGKPLQVTRTFRGTEAKAKVALGRFCIEVVDGKLTPTTATFGQVLDEWLRRTERTQRPRTVQENRSKINSRIRPALGALQLDKLTPKAIEDAYDQWLSEGRRCHAVIATRAA